MKIITVSGQIGSGKSSVATSLANILNWEVVSTGSIQRHLAQECGMTTLEFNLHSEAHLDLDDLIDSNLISLRTTTKDTVVDSRMAWFFLPESLKIFLIIDPIIGARRVFRAERSTETYTSADDALEEIRQRQESERKRFAQKYNVDYTDFHNHDLIIDTTYASMQDEIELILSSLAKSKSEGPRVWLCPKRLYPTQHVRTLLNIDSEYDSSVEIEKSLPPIEVIRLGESFFIYNGHKRVSRALQRNCSFIPVTITFTEGDEIVPGLAVEEYIRGECKLSWVYDWEDCHNFRFPGYPSEQESAGGPGFGISGRLES